jgi:hypothetical protein
MDTLDRYSGSNTVARILDLVFRRPVVEPSIPVCPQHNVEMTLRGKMGRPARFSDTSQQTYTVIYVCPVVGCDHTEEREQARAQIAVPGIAPRRPDFSRRGN